MVAFLHHNYRGIQIDFIKYTTDLIHLYRLVNAESLSVIFVSEVLASHIITQIKHYSNETVCVQNG